MSAGYEAVIGLEVHCELATESKIFCGCKNAFGAEVNTLCCPVCTGMPGSLPVLNRQVVDYAIKMGHALGCTIHNVTKLDRKNYFYPDLPKAYQITQFDVPLCENGTLEIPVDGGTRRVGITRIHIEEDAGKLTHDGAGGSLIDYNRSGVPLIEIVTEPDLRSADEAKALMEEIARILLYLGISDAKMQEGSLRADVNVSLRPAGQVAYGTRTEIKNVNSFGAVHRAILYEVDRQAEVLSRGGTVEQETRRWDDAAGKSAVMRTKETVQDYRFFPDPDLLTVVVPPERVQALREGLPELPIRRRARYVADYGLPPQDAANLCAKKDRADFFEAAAALDKAPARALANWMLGDVAALLNERGAELADTALTPENLAGMLALIEAGAISGTAGKALLPALMDRDAPPEKLVEELGLGQVSDGAALEGLVAGVLAENPKAVADYISGKAAALGFLVGQCMKASRGRGNPALLRELLERRLAE